MLTEILLYFILFFLNTNVQHLVDLWPSEVHALRNQCQFKIIKCQSFQLLMLRLHLLIIIDSTSWVYMEHNPSASFVTLLYYVRSQRPLKCHFRGPVDYIRLINQVHQEEYMRGDDMKSYYSTTSDTLNVILISQSQSEPPFFNLFSPPFLFSFFHVPFT